MWHTLNVDGKIDKMKQIIDKKIFDRKYEDALSLIMCLSNILFYYNQYFQDDFLEEKMEVLCKKLDDKTNDKQKNTDVDDWVFFYDGIGSDAGLALIYIKALVATGKKRIVYLVREQEKGNFPELLSLLKKYNVEIFYIPQGISLLEEYLYIYNTQKKFNIKEGFLYTLPYDVSGILAFMCFKNLFTRYMIDHVDHTFWLGIHAFDYCIQFGDRGSFISNSCRKIPKERIVKLPYYPYINKEKKFEGFPFAVEDGDFIIFSGGTIYKTIDEKENLYYKMVDFCLKEFENTKFWYVGRGEGDNTCELKKLEEKYAGRVFWSEKGRNDLFQVLKHVDLYLNTYPVGGGLMMQYSAAAGRVPLSLSRGSESRALIGQENLGIEFSRLEDIKEEIRKIITDKEYRKSKEHEVLHACINEIDFERNLSMLLKQHVTEYEISYTFISDLEKYKKINYEKFGKYGVEGVIGKNRYVRLRRICPVIYLYSRIIKKIYG